MSGKRWKPKVGERVTLIGDGRDIPQWTGDVIRVTKSDCRHNQVYLEISGHGSTFADKHEILIHHAKAEGK